MVSWSSLGGPAGVLLRRSSLVVGVVGGLLPVWAVPGWLFGWRWAALTVGVIAVYALLCPLGSPYFGVLPLLGVLPLMVGGLALLSYVLGVDFTPNHCDPYIDECASTGGDPYEVRRDQEDTFWLAKAFVLCVAAALIWAGAKMAWSFLVSYRAPSRPALLIGRATAKAARERQNDRRIRQDHELEEWADELRRRSR